MTGSDLERRLAAALRQHAEDAMRHTRTEEKLETLLVDAGRTARRRRLGWAAGVAVATAAAVAAVLALLPVLGDDEPESVGPAGTTSPVGVARAYLYAYQTFDRDEAATYLAPAVEDVSPEWRQENRWFQAVQFQVLVDSCEKQGSTAAGTQVACPYDFHALRSDDLGRGPFTGNLFTATVREGELVELDWGLEFLSNGFSRQMWEPFAAWVSRTHPKDAAVMYADWPDTTLQSLDDRSIRLWKKNTVEYGPGG